MLSLLWSISVAVMLAVTVEGYRAGDIGGKIVCAIGLATLAGLIFLAMAGWLESRGL